MHYLYMIKNRGNKLYIGVTENPVKRLVRHNHKTGAQFTQNNPSFGVVFLEEYSSLAEARKREIQIKKWRRDKKDKLVTKYSQGLETKM